MKNKKMAIILIGSVLLIGLFIGLIVLLSSSSNERKKSNNEWKTNNRCYFKRRYYKIWNTYKRSI